MTIRNKKIPYIIMSRPACAFEPTMTLQVIIEICGVCDVTIDNSSGRAILALVTILGSLWEKPVKRKKTHISKAEMPVIR
jgi:hypothetical protein